MIQKDGRTILFDAFIKQGVLYLVSTYRSVDEPPLSVKVNGVRATEVGHKEYEPVRFFFVRAPANPTIELEIDAEKYSLTVRSVESRGAHGIGVATLFKDDWHRIPAFVEYYTQQGVTDFWFYYNGAVLPEGLPVGANIHYRLWDFEYWNHTNWSIGRRVFAHNAQTAFLTSARLLCLSEVEWLAIVDLDEWVSHPERTLAQYLGGVNPGVVGIKVRNHWARSDGDRIEYSLTPLSWNTRTKCIYRTSYTGLFGIHVPKRPDGIICSEDLRMLHIADDHMPDRKLWVTAPTASYRYRAGVLEAL